MIMPIGITLVNFTFDKAAARTYERTNNTIFEACKVFALCRFDNDLENPWQVDVTSCGLEKLKRTGLENMRTDLRIWGPTLSVSVPDVLYENVDFVFKGDELIIEPFLDRSPYPGFTGHITTRGFLQ